MGKIIKMYSRKFLKEQKKYHQKLRDLANEYLLFCETEINSEFRKVEHNRLDKIWVDFAIKWNVNPKTEINLRLLDFENFIIYILHEKEK